MQAQRSTGVWGLAEAGLAWISAQLFGLVGLVGIIAFGGWSVYTPARPGGHLGRATGQIAAGESPADDAVPLVWQLLSLIPMWAGMLGVAWLFAAALGRSRPGWRIEIAPADVVSGALTGLLLQIPVIPLLYVLIEALFGEIAPTGRALALTDRVDSVAEVVLIFAFVAIGAPVVEELFYRGLVQRALVDRLGPGVGIVTASLVFGAVHFSWIELPALALVGLAFGLLYWRTGRLGPAIVGHVTFNSVTLVNLLAASA